MTPSRPIAVTAAVATMLVSALGLSGCADSKSATPGPATATAGFDDGAPALARRFVAAFNSGDARALAGLFTEDAEFVNIYGIRMSGRSGIEHGHQAAFASRLDGATLTLQDVEQHAVTNDLAVVQVEWHLERAPDADPDLVVPDSAGVLTFTALRSPAGWHFVCGANVMESTPPS